MFEVRLQTYWEDADPAGQVFFAHFFRFAEHAETELFRSNGVERMSLYRDLDILMPRVESFARFMKPIPAEAAILVRLQTRFKGEKTVRMEFEVLSAIDRSLLAEGYVTAVCVDRQNRKSRPLPPVMREIFDRARADTSDPYASIASK